MVLFWKEHTCYLKGKLKSQQSLKKEKVWPLLLHQLLVLSREKHWLHFFTFGKLLILSTRAPFSSHLRSSCWASNAWGEGLSSLHQMLSLCRLWIEEDVLLNSSQEEPASLLNFYSFFRVLFWLPYLCTNSSSMFTELTIECSLHGLQSPQIWSNMNKLHPTMQAITDQRYYVGLVPILGIDW